jgi:hypothetical protein
VTERSRDPVEHQVQFLAHVFSKKAQHQVAVLLEQLILAPVAAVCDRIREMLSTVACSASANTLASLNSTFKVYCANGASVRVPVKGLCFRDDCARREVVVWPACEHDDLKHARLFGKKLPEPVHPRDVTLHELIVENDGRPQVLRERKTVQR